MKRLLFASAIGALLAYFLDPNRGASRRNQLKQQLGGPVGQGGKSASSAVQSVASNIRSTTSKASSAATNASGAAQGAAPHTPDNPDPDDTTLKDRIESEIFRDKEYSREHINVNVEYGVVELRGELPNTQEINDLIARVRAIPNVKDVISYLHLPGTPAPNKEQALEVQ